MGARSLAFRALVVLGLVAGCSKGAPDGSTGTGAGPAPSARVVDPGGPATPAPAAPADAADAVDAPLASREAYATARPLGGKSVGHTSIVFKLKLEGGLEAAYKPRSTVGAERYRGEIAASRLARALSLSNVPYAAPRTFARADLERAVGREAAFAKVVSERGPDGGDGEVVRGALIPWIKGLRFVELGQSDEVAKWRPWLKAGAPIPEDQRARAAQISTMITFDVLTGNWDRWSGGNVGLDEATGQLLFLDNDGAFYDPVPAREMKRGRDYFDGVDRFSRAFVGALRALDAARALGEIAPGEPLLSPRVVEQCDARRKRILAAIDAKIARWGEAEVLPFE